MKTLNDINKQIEIIENGDFNVKETVDDYKVCSILRNARSCSYSIGMMEDVTEEKKLELSNKLYKIMKEKFKSLNPNFSEETIDNMIASCSQGVIYSPVDIFVVDDAVFYKNEVLDDFGMIFETKTVMPNNIPPYYNVLHPFFTSRVLNPFSPEAQNGLTGAEQMYTSRFISGSINSIYGANITKPICELTVYGKEIVVGEVYGVNAYINMHFDDIGKSIRSKSESDIKLCIQKEDNINLYYIHQTFKDGNPVWNVVRTDNHVWKLSEEILKRNNKCTDLKQLVKKPKKRNKGQQ